MLSELQEIPDHCRGPLNFPEFKTNQNGQTYQKRNSATASRLGGAERPEVLAGEDLPDALGLRAVRGVGEDLRELRGLERLAALRACADSKIAKLAFFKTFLKLF